MRLFVAVLPPADALAELETAVAALRALPGTERLRWTGPEGRHLTLAFLGEVAPEQLPALRDGLAQAALGCPAHRLRLAGGGRFGDRVLWVGLAGQTWALRVLARAVTQLAGEVLAVDAGGGSQPEAGAEFAYHPHLTLARTGRGGHPGREERAVLRAAADELTGYQGREWGVTHVHLMRSNLGGGPARYTSIGSWRLHEPRESQQPR
jgi:2'-5' RNA ligase